MILHVNTNICHIQKIRRITICHARRLNCLPVNQIIGVVFRGEKRTSATDTSIHFISRSWGESRSTPTGRVETATYLQTIKVTRTELVHDERNNREDGRVFKANAARVRTVFAFDLVFIAGVFTRISHTTVLMLFVTRSYRFYIYVRVRYDERRSDNTLGDTLSSCRLITSSSCAFQL